MGNALKDSVIGRRTCLPVAPGEIQETGYERVCGGGRGDGG